MLTKEKVKIKVVIELYSIFKLVTCYLPKVLVSCYFTEQ